MLFTFRTEEKIATVASEVCMPFHNIPLGDVARRAFTYLLVTVYTNIYIHVCIHTYVVVHILV